MDRSEGNATTVPDPPQRRGRVGAQRGRRSRFRFWPVFWGCAGTVGFVVGSLIGVPDLALGIALAVPLMIAAVGLGWRSTLPLIPIGLGLVFLRYGVRGETLGLGLSVSLAAALLLAGAAGQNLFGLWRASDRRARAHERRSRLLSQATLELHGTKDTDALYANALRLLADVLTFEHATIFAPANGALRLRAGLRVGLAAGFEVPLDSVIGKAFTTGRTQYVPDTTIHPGYRDIAELGSTASELALPIRRDGAVHAVLNVEHDTPAAFGPADHSTLAAFCRIIEDVLARHEALEEARRQRTEQAFIASLSQRLLLADNAADAARSTLEQLFRDFRFSAGAVTLLKGARLRPLAVHGDVSDELQRLLQAGIPSTGLIRQAWTDREPIYVPDCRTDPRVGELGRSLGIVAFAIAPITNARREMQALLLLVDQEGPRAWDAGDRGVLEIVATSLGAALERATVHRQFMALLDTVRGLARSERPEDLYAQAAEAAVQLIPGAEAASILVRSSEGYRYMGTAGYSLEALTSIAPFKEDDILRWYQDGPEAFHKGIPRVVVGKDVAKLSSAAGGKRGREIEADMRIHDIHANLNVPITDHGEVVATLNIDSFSDQAAFGSAALRLAEAFGLQIAVIVRQTRALGELRRSALTDALTGLGNRAGFDQRLEEELRRAARYGKPMSLILIDLDAFKLVNDTHGHATGDGALIAVAEVLRREQRISDGAFRWGGDEFVMLLPEIGAEGAARVAERIGRNIESSSFGDRMGTGNLRLRASFGIASYPRDGLNRDVLLDHADRQMYRNKAT